MQRNTVSQLFGVSLMLCLLAAVPAHAQQIKIASYRALGFFPAWFAKDAGFFEREGLNAEILFFNSGGEMTSAMLSGSVAFSTTSPDRPMLLKEKGQNTLNLIAMTVRSPLSIVTSSSSTLPYGDVAALKGKRIGITALGSATDVGIRAILRPSGLDPDKDVTLLPLGTAENGVAALAAGHIDALVVTEPSTSVAIDKKIGRMFLDLRKGEGPPAAIRATFFTLQATADFVKANPETTRKAIRAMCKAVHAAKLDFDRAFKVAQNHFSKLDPDVLKAALQSELQTFGTEISDDMIQAVSNMALEIKVTRKPYAMDDVVIAKEFRADWKCN